MSDGDDAARGDVANGASTDADESLVGGIGYQFVRFVSVVLAVDVLGLGAWWLLPEGVPIRTGVLVGTLVIAPLLGFLVVYAPAVSRSRNRPR